MDKIPFLIIWGLLVFVLPRIFGKKKTKKQYDYPDEGTNTMNTEGTSQEEKPWFTWGLPEEEKAEEVRPVVLAEKVVEQVPKTQLPQPKKEMLTVKIKKAGGRKVSYREVARGMVMAEVLGKPRALKPYSDEF